MVASVAKAFAPFSQNSNPLLWLSGSGHAHPGQSNPSNRLTERIVCIVLRIPVSAIPILNEFVTALKPATLEGGFLMRSFSSSIGVIARTGDLAMIRTSA